MRNFLAILIGFLFSTQASALYGNSYVLVQAGGFWGNSGKEQHINVQTLIGDDYTVTEDGSGNALLGLGYFFKTAANTRYRLDLGVNVFYLFDMEVGGNVIQENLFENLSYTYDVANVPVYAAMKASFNTFPKQAFTFDAGIGPNFMLTRNYREEPLGSGNTQPDNKFLDDTTVVFTGMLGLGYKFDIKNSVAVEVGYRFFYLGSGNFENSTSQIQNTFETGSTYANALTLSVSI